ncbi:hypothetical protein Btru_062355 [Bulinus truncatus]|nr:hypothetical protein Btru_062355 [Bulinus truncatus]
MTEGEGIRDKDDRRREIREGLKKVEEIRTSIADFIDPSDKVISLIVSVNMNPAFDILFGNWDQLDMAPT